MCRTFAVLLLLVTGPTLAAAQTRVQHASSDRFNLDPTGFSVAYGSPVTLGNTEIVLVRSLSAGADVVTSVTATRATLSLIVSDVSHDPLLYLYAGAITSSGAETVSATWTTADPNYVWMEIIEVAGASATASATGQVATTGATDQVCSALTTSGPGYVVMGASEAATNTYTAGTDSASHLWTLLNGSIGTTPNFFGGVQDYLAAGSLSAVTPHIPSSDGSATYTTVCAAFLATTTTGGRSGLSLLGVGRP